MLGVQKCWEGKSVGSSKMLGVQKCWKVKNVGSTKMLGGQKCWKVKNVRSHTQLQLAPVHEVEMLDQIDGGSN